MSKKASLGDALRHASGRAEPPKPQEVPLTAAKTNATPSRRGKKCIGGYFDPAASRQLRQIAIDEESNVQELLREALNDLFEKRGKSRIA